MGDSAVDCLPSCAPHLAKKVVNGFMFEAHSKYRMEEKSGTPSALQAGTKFSNSTRQAQESPSKFGRQQQPSPSKSQQPQQQPTPEALAKALYMHQNALKLANGDLDKASKFHFAAGTAFLENGCIRDAASAFLETSAYASKIVREFKEQKKPACYHLNFEVPEEKKMLAALMIKYKAEIYLGRLFFLYSRNLGISHFFNAITCIIPRECLENTASPSEISKTTSEIFERILPVAEFMDSQSKNVAPNSGFLYHLSKVLVEVTSCLTSTPTNWSSSDNDEEYQKIAVFLCHLVSLIQRKLEKPDECMKLLDIMSECYYRVNEKWWGIDKSLEAVTLVESLPAETPLGISVQDRLASAFVNALILDDFKRLKILLERSNSQESTKLMVLREIAEACLYMDSESLDVLQKQHVTFLRTDKVVANALANVASRLRAI